VVRAVSEDEDRGDVRDRRPVHAGGGGATGAPVRGDRDRRQRLPVDDLAERDGATRSNSKVPSSILGDRVDHERPRDEDREEDEYRINTV